jgi:hypothetical protein
MIPNYTLITVSLGVLCSRRDRLAIFDLYLTATWWHELLHCTVGHGSLVRTLEACTQELCNLIIRRANVSITAPKWHFDCTQNWVISLKKKKKSNNSCVLFDKIYFAAIVRCKMSLVYYGFLKSFIILLLIEFTMIVNSYYVCMYFFVVVMIDLFFLVTFRLRFDGSIFLLLEKFGFPSDWFPIKIEYFKHDPDKVITI